MVEKPAAPNRQVHHHERRDRHQPHGRQPQDSVTSQPGDCGLGARAAGKLAHQAASPAAAPDPEPQHRADERADRRNGDRCRRRKHDAARDHQRQQRKRNGGECGEDRRADSRAHPPALERSSQLRQTLGARPLAKRSQPPRQGSRRREREHRGELPPAGFPAAVRDASAGRGLHPRQRGTSCAAARTMRQMRRMRSSRALGPCAARQRAPFSPVRREICRGFMRAETAGASSAAHGSLSWSTPMRTTEPWPIRSRRPSTRSTCWGRTSTAVCDSGAARARLTAAWAPSPSWSHS